MGINPLVTSAPVTPNARPGPRKLVSIAHSYAVAVNRRLAHEMVVAGEGRWEVTAVAPSYFHGSGDLRPVTFEPLPDEPYRMEIVPARWTRFVHIFHYTQRLKQILAEPWDMIHAWEEPYILAGHQIARWARPGVPLIYRTAQSLNKKYPVPFNWMERYNMARAAGWICSGTLVAESLGAREMYQKRSSRLIPLGVDLSFYRADSAAAERTFTELGWERNGPPIIGYLGRFVTAKGIRFLTEVLDELNLPWRALFIGAGPMEVYLRRWAARYGDHVRICTSVRHNDVPRHFGVMSVMAAPSQTTRRWREQFGRMLIESFGCGVPVIGSDSGEIPYVIGDAGIVCGEKDHHAWVRELRSLLNSPARSAELAQRGLDRVHRLYTWPVVARNYISFFNAIATTAS
jgi:glycosyltransferase involved in cell wall biosynthesis